MDILCAIKRITNNNPTYFVWLSQEILRSNLATVILQMKAMGITNVKEFDFIDKPEEEAFTKSIESL